MHEDRARWEGRHAEGASRPIRPPSSFIQAHLAALPCGSALDVACGDGRNALLLARHGFEVDAIDIAAAGLRRAQATARAEHLPIRCVQADLDQFPLPPERYRVAVNVRYLSRTLFPSLKRTVRAGGIVVFETFTVEQAQLGHPTNPDYLLRRGELRDVFNDFEVIVYEEGRFDDATGSAYLARMLARRPPGWKPH